MDNPLLADDILPRTSSNDQRRRELAPILRRAAADAGVVLWPMCFANDAMLHVVAPDDAELTR